MNPVALFASLKVRFLIFKIFILILFICFTAVGLSCGMWTFLSLFQHKSSY